MNIYQKIAAVMQDVQYLSKDDQVAFGNTKYRAISEEKVTSEVREKLIKHGLVIFPIRQEHKREGTLSTVDVTYRIVNVEMPEESIEVVSSGTGVDTQDKGVGKAMTYAYKYMLLRTFAIPTGEDPDKISSAELDAKEKQQEEKKQKEKQKQNKPTPQSEPETPPKLATNEQKEELASYCKAKKLNLERLLVSNGATWDVLTEEQVNNSLAGLKSRYGE